MPAFEKTKRNQVVRLPERGFYDRETIYPIIDEAIFCHVGFVQDNQPFVIPTLHARQGDNLLLHGATTSRLIKHAQAGNQLCITITLLDGLVLARSVFHHSANYRSVVLFGAGYLIEDYEEKIRAMETFTEKILPGRWSDARQPNPIELKATSIVAIPIESASAKVRTGGPKDDAEDYQLPVWAGVLPIKQQIGSPQADSQLAENIAIPDYIVERVMRRNSCD